MSPIRWFRRKSRSPQHRPVARPRLLTLEDRLAPATLDLLAGGNLAYTGANVNNTLTFSTSAGNFVYNNPLDPITLGAGAIAAGYTVSGGGATAMGPIAAASAHQFDFGTANNTANFGPFSQSIDVPIQFNGSSNPMSVSFGSMVDINASSVFDGIGSLTINAPVRVKGTLTVRANSIDLQNTLEAGSRINFSPVTASRPVNLGTEVAGALSLTDAELDRITTPTLQIGSVTTGTISITQSVSPANVPTLSLVTGQFIDDGPAGQLQVASLALRAGVVNLDGNHAIGTIAGDIQTDFTIRQTSLLTVDAVDGVAGITSGSGSIDIRSDQLEILQPISSFFNVQIAPVTANRFVVLGGLDSAGQLGLTDAELDRVTADVLAIGNATSGSVFVTAPISQAGSGYLTLSLTSSGVIAGIGGSVAGNVLELRATTGIQLATDVFALAFFNATSGAVTINNASSLSLLGLGSTPQLRNNGATTSVTANGILQVISDVSSVGTITFTAVDAAGLGQEVQILGSSFVMSSTGDVVFQAGDNILIQPSGIVQAAGVITLVADFGDADPGLGATVSFAGSSLDANSVTATGGADDDIFNVGPSASTPIAIDGAGGVNTLNFDALDLNVTVTATTITAAGLQPVTYANIATVSIVDSTGVTIQGTAGDDAFTVVRSTSGVLVALSGGPTINVGEQATVINGLSGTNALTFDFGGGSPLPAGGLSINNVSLYTVLGTAGDDTVDLQRAVGLIQFTINGGGLVALPGATAFRFEGLGGNDTFRVLYADGDPVPALGATFDGGAGDDALGVFGAGNVAVYRPSATTPGDGAVEVDSGTIAFLSLSPVDITGMGLAIVSLPGGNDVIAVDNGFDFTNGGATPAIRVSGTSGGVAIETAALWNNDSVRIDTQLVDGNDAITVNSATVGNNTNLTIVTGGGSDNVTVAAGLGISLTGQLNIGSGGITILGPLTSSGPGGGMTFTNSGLLTIGGVAINSQGQIVQNGTGNVSIIGNSTVTTNTGTISIMSPVTLTAGVTASFNSTGNAPITFASTLNGGGDVTVTTGGVTTLAGAIGAVTPLASLTTNGGGTTAINGASVTTTGAQQYDDAVTLGSAATQFTSTGNGAITFGGTLDGASDVTIATGGAVTFSAAVGGTLPLLSLTTDVGGSTAVNGGLVQTVNGQQYSDNVTVGAAATNFVSSNAGAIAFGQLLNGASAVTVDTAGFTLFDRAVGGVTPLTSLTVIGGGFVSFVGGQVRTTGEQTFLEPVFVGMPSANFISLGNAPIFFGSSLNGSQSATVNTGGLTTFMGPIGNLQPLINLTVTGGGTTAINGGLVVTRLNQSYFDAVVLGAPSTQFLSTLGGTITFNSTLDGASAVSITALNAIAFFAPVGSVTPLTSLTVVGGPIDLNAGTVTTVGDQSYAGAVILTSDTVLNGANISFSFTVDSDGTPRSLLVNGSGITTFGGDVGGTSALSSLTTNAAGSTRINGSAVTTIGGQTYGDAVTLGAAATLFTSTGNGDIAFGSTLNGTSNVTVTTGGLTAFGGAVGSVTPLTSLTTNGGGATAINGGSVITTAAQSYGDAVTLGSPAVQLISTSGGAIVFSSTLNGASALTITTAGATDFLGAVGGVVPLTSLTTNGGGTTDINGGLVTTVGDQTYNEPVILTADTILNGVNVTFAQSLNSDGTPRTLLVNGSGVTTFGGAVGGTSPLASLTTNAAGSTRINGGAVTTTGSQSYGDAVTLSFGSAGATTTTLTANAAGPGGITFGSTLNGATPRNQALNLIANAGDINFNGAVGGTTELGAVTVASARNVTIGAAFNATSLFQTIGTGTTAINGPTTLSSTNAFNVTNVAITLNSTLLAPASGAGGRLNGTAAGVSQPAGSILVGAVVTPQSGRDGALTLNGSGAFTLNQAANDVGTLAANVNGPITFRDANDLTIASPGGLVSNNNPITVTTGRNFTAINTNFATPLIDAGAAALQVNPGVSAGAVVTLNAEIRAGSATFGNDLGAPLSNALPDQFFIRPSRNVGITVKGNRPSPILGDPIPPGDQLQPNFAGIAGRVVLTPAGLGAGVYSFPDDTVKPLTFFEIENLVGFSTSAYSVQTGPTSYGIRTVNQQLGTIIQGGVQGGQVPANPFVVAPAFVNPFGPFGAPRIAFGDVNGDGTADLIIANGPNNSPLVTVINGTALLNPNNISLDDPTNILAQFYAYDPAFPGGLFVSAGDFDGDGRAEIVTGPDVGGGPHVRILEIVLPGDIGFIPGVTTIYTNVRSYQPTATAAIPADFNAYDPSFIGGVRLAVGDVNGDGRPDIVTGAGTGGGPHVKVFSGATGDVIRSFFAYAPTFTGGIYVGAGDYNQDGFADILTGAGNGGAPHVEIFCGATVLPTLLASFFAFPTNPGGGFFPNPDATTGVGSVAFTDINGDGQLDILVGTNRGPQARALVFRGPGFTPLFVPGDELLISPGLRDGVNVAGNAVVISGP